MRRDGESHVVAVNLPWVARSTLEVVKEERDRLREQNEQLLDHLKRVDRARHGMAEKPIEKKPRDPMPDGVRKILQGFENPQIREQMSREAERLHAQGVAWQTVQKRLEESV